MVSLMLLAVAVLFVWPWTVGNMGGCGNGGGNCGGPGVVGGDVGNGTHATLHSWKN